MLSDSFYFMYGGMLAACSIRSLNFIGGDIVMSGSENTNSNKCVNEKSCCDVMYIDKCKYIVNSHFSEKKSAETVTQKIEKLILNEALKNI